MFRHDICLKGRLYTFLIFSAFKIHNSVSLWVKITRKPNSIWRPSLCFARKQSSNPATGCDVINRWIIGTRNFAKSWAPPGPSLVHAFIIGRIDYCNSLLFGSPSVHLLNYKLRRLQNAAARPISNIPRYSHITPVLC